MRRYAWWREEMRDRSTFMYYLVRRWTLEAARRATGAGRLAEAGDIWFLSWRDVVALLEGRLEPARARALIEQGRHVHRSFRDFDNPDEIGAHFRAGEIDLEGDVRRGTPCAGGVVTGRARVLEHLDEAGRVEPGDILVTAFTDPGWTPLFARIAAVVTETGGVLSHAAVISREYGIPAVLEVSGATEAIADGDRIRVDGDRGLVEIVERAG
ncbi:MAG: PEP-utilizing enzyme [Gemmatimonadota bacterium]|nr:PEP-utilizing enzyme [Gemmatimonadota bacterium]